MQRISMNSKSLQAVFPEVYREIFARSLIVCSASRLFYWTGEYSESYGGPYLCHKLPLRTYIGLEPIDRNRIKTSYYQVFSPAKQQFKATIFDQNLEKKLTSYLEDYLEKNKLRKKDDPGFIINIVAELPFESGLSSTAGITAALATAIHLYFKLITPAEINKWSSSSVKDLLSKNELKFKQVHNLAWKLEGIINNVSGSGGQSFASLLPSANPVLYFTEERSGDVANHPEGVMPHEIDGDNDLIDKIKFIGYRPEEIIRSKKFTGWPLDYGLIFSGDSRITENVVRSVYTKKANLEETEDFIKKELSISASTVKPFFLKFCEREKGFGLWQKYIEMSASISMEVIYRFKKLFDSGPSEEEMRLFFRALNHNQNLLRIFDISTPTINFITNYIREKIKSISDYPTLVASKIVGAGRGGDILFVVPYGTLRNQIDEMVEELVHQTRKDIFLDYANWLDGECEDGVMVEQSIDHEIYSNFISKGAIRTRNFSKNGTMNSELYSLEEFKEESKNFPLIIDMLEKDVYINNVKLTSKELHSACATVDILKFLICHPNKSIPNDELPKSIYSEDRNELQSKIISPLLKAVKKHTGEKLNLSLTGGIVDFRIELLPSNFDILLIEKKF